MRIAVFGAGAIGGFLAARLAEAGHDLSLIARGPHLKALRKHGLRLESEEFGSSRYSVQATEDPADIGPVDYVILGVKANALTTIAPLCNPLLGKKTAVVSLQNGIPWWYFHGIGADGIEADEPPLESVDPGGVIARHLPPACAIGGIAYISASIARPGVINHTHGARFPLGEPAGGRTARTKAFSQALLSGGIKAPIRGDVRHEIWVKLMGNAIFNPLSALTRKTMREMVEFPETRELIRRAMEEARETAAAAGVQIAFSTDRRIEGARQAGDHRTSMLQDVEAGRTPELEPLTGAVVELAGRKNVETPSLFAVYAAAKSAFSSSARA